MTRLGWQGRIARHTHTQCCFCESFSERKVGRCTGGTYLWCGTNDGSHEGQSPDDLLVVLHQLDQIIAGANLLPIFVVYTVQLLIVIVEQT